MYNAFGPLVATAEVVPVGKYAPVLELVVLLSDGADAEPRGFCIPELPEIITDMSYTPTLAFNAAMSAACAVMSVCCSWMALVSNATILA